MLKRVLFFFILNLCGLASAQVVQGPVAHTVELERKDGSYYAGRSYYRWAVDISHDGLKDMLICEKERPDEVEMDRQRDRWFFKPSVHGFTVYIGLPHGGYVLASSAVTGELEGHGITVDLSHCYVGYVSEVKRHGIVTVESLTVADPDVPQARHGVLKNQVVFYTINRDHIKRTNLSPQFDDSEINRIYDKYLADSKRTKVQLQEVTP